MSVIQSCHDTKDTLDLFRPQSLYLKPIARLNVSVQLPQLKKSGAKISNWEVMEKCKEMAKPLTFSAFKVAKSSLEFIRFEAEIDNYGSMEKALAKLDMKTIKLSGFQDLLKVRAAEAKPPFPTRHDWDSFFRENKNMDEMKPGERPDTIHVQNLPTKWFLNHHDRSGISKEKPSMFVLKKVFGNFGEIRRLDIPMLDPYRDKMKSGGSEIQTFSFGQDLVFDAYIMFQEYIGFVKAMNSLKGMKLLYKDRYEDRAWVANIKVDFDKTKYLAESTIKKREEEREKLVQSEREKEEKERRDRDLEELKRADEIRKIEEEDRARSLRMESEQQLKMRRRMEREERRRQMKLKAKFQTDEEEMAARIAVEERKLLIAQRKLESIRLLDELLERVKDVKGQGKRVLNLEADLLETAKRASKKTKIGTPMTYKDQDEKVLRDKLVNRLKEKEVLKMEHFGERLKNAKENNYLDSSDDGVEDISDDDLEQPDIEYGDEFKGKEDEDLRLTSTDDDNDEKIRDISGDDGFERSSSEETKQKIKRESKDELIRDTKRERDIKGEEIKNGETKSSNLYENLPDPKNQGSCDDESDNSSAKTKKRRKKDKKEKKKKKKKEKERERSEKDDIHKKKRELESQIHLAKKIAEKEKREMRQSQESSDDARYDYRHKNRSLNRNNDHNLVGKEFEEKAAYPDYREKMLAKRREDARQAAREKRAAMILQQKKLEQAKDEVYDQLVKGGGKSYPSSDKMRKLRKGEHYEDAQREFLENEIRIRDRREKYSAVSNASNRRVDFSNRGGAADFVDSRYHFAGRERTRSTQHYEQDYNFDRRESRYNYEKR